MSALIKYLLPFPIRWWSVRLHRLSTSLPAKMHHGVHWCSLLRWWLLWCEQCRTQVTWRQLEPQPVSFTTCPIRGRACSPSSSLEESLLWFACSGTSCQRKILDIIYLQLLVAILVQLWWFIFPQVSFRLDTVIWVYKNIFRLRV